MASVVDEESRAVTFLYKFKKGAYSRSHGVNVARIAGLPESILSRAEVIGSRRDLGDDCDHDRRSHLGDYLGSFR